MKIITSLLSVLLFCVTALGQTTNPKYDSLLAKKVGADDFGMKSYVFVVLKSGENKSTDKAFKDSCFAGHMKNINHMVEIKKLVVAGPFGKNDNNFRGLFIMSVANIDEAKKLLEGDPAVKEKFLTAEYYPWYGSAALSEYLEASDKVWKKGF